MWTLPFGWPNLSLKLKNAKNQKKMESQKNGGKCLILITTSSKLTNFSTGSNQLILHTFNKEEKQFWLVAPLRLRVEINNYNTVCDCMSDL